MRALFLGGPLHLTDQEPPETGRFFFKFGSRLIPYERFEYGCCCGAMQVYVCGSMPTINACLYLAAIQEVERELLSAGFPACQFLAARSLFVADREFRSRIDRIIQSNPRPKAFSYAAPSSPRRRA